MSTLVDRLAVHVADFGLLFIKLHNYHWHITGSDFMPIHLMTESYYDELADHYDAIAERIVQLGGTAPASAKEYISLAGIKEETKKSFTGREIIAALKDDFEYLLKTLKETRCAASEANDTTTDSLLTDIIADFEKKHWMIRASL